jgi:hypothetical protein
LHKDMPAKNKKEDVQAPILRALAIEPTASSGSSQQPAAYAVYLFIHAMYEVVTQVGFQVHLLRAACGI